MVVHKVGQKLKYLPVAPESVEVFWFAEPEYPFVVIAKFEYSEGRREKDQPIVHAPAEELACKAAGQHGANVVIFQKEEDWSDSGEYSRDAYGVFARRLGY